MGAEGDIGVYSPLADEHAGCCSVYLQTCRVAGAVRPIEAWQVLFLPPIAVMCVVMSVWYNGLVGETPIGEQASLMEGGDRGQWKICSRQ
jgi:hypothetical protein